MKTVLFTILGIFVFGFVLFVLGGIFLNRRRAPLDILDTVLGKVCVVTEIQNSIDQIGHGIHIKTKSNNILYYRSDSGNIKVERIEVLTENEEIKFVVSDGKVSMLKHSNTVMVFNPELSDEENRLIFNFLAKVRDFYDKTVLPSRHHIEAA
jgi:ABC-type transport system involved in multi-copper enzyme maturation permease subunit